ncbi:MAG: Ku protein [Bacillota bacterium]
MDALRAMWKGTISFGLVTIPVKLYAATESKDLRFNLLHEPCQTPVQYRKYCPTCDREVGNEEIVKGYEFERGRYVTLREEDFESIPLAARRTLEIVAFVRLEEIDPIYFDKTYYLEPGEGGAKAYALLRRAMEETGRVAIARMVLRAKESLAALRVFREGVLAMETMHFPDEVRPVSALTGITQPALRPQEVEMAKGLIESLTMPFTPEPFANTYRDALMELIQAKIAGLPPAAPGPAPEQGRVVDLMEALRASIRAARAQRAPEGPATDGALADGALAGRDGAKEPPGPGDQAAAGGRVMPGPPVERDGEAAPEHPAQDGLAAEGRREAAGPARRAIPGLPGAPAGPRSGTGLPPVPDVAGGAAGPGPGKGFRPLADGLPGARSDEMAPGGP